MANMILLEKIGAQLLQFGVPGNKEPFVDIPEDVMREALLAVISMLMLEEFVHWYENSFIA